MKKFNFRSNVLKEDAENVRRIILSSGFFSEEETEIAVELVEEYLSKGEESGYYFLFAECEGKTVGYTCFGPIPATKLSYDLYWIAVHQNYRGEGLGKILMEMTDKLIYNLGGRRVYIETSGREQYFPTRKFYTSCNCKLEAELIDFYAPGDSKLIYVREL